MAFEEFITFFDTSQLVLILAVFGIFLFVMHRVIKTLFSLLWVVIASIAFPFVANLLGLNIPIDLNTIVFFIVAGIGTYVLYLIAKIIYKALGLVEGVGSIFSSKKKD